MPTDYFQKPTSETVGPFTISSWVEYDYDYYHHGLGEYTRLCDGRGLIVAEFPCYSRKCEALILDYEYRNQPAEDTSEQEELYERLKDLHNRIYRRLVKAGDKYEYYGLPWRDGAPQIPKDASFWYRTYIRVTFRMESLDEALEQKVGDFYRMWHPDRGEWWEKDVGDDSGNTYNFIHRGDCWYSGMKTERDELQSLFDSYQRLEAYERREFCFLTVCAKAYFDGQEVGESSIGGYTSDDQESIDHDGLPSVRSEALARAKEWLQGEAKQQLKKLAAAIADVDPAGLQLQQEKTVD